MTKIPSQKEGTIFKPYEIKEIENIRIKAYKTAQGIEIRIEPDFDFKIKEKIQVYYKPSDSYRRGDFCLEDDQIKIRIDRAYPVASGDGDIDWDFETIYPCERCDILTEMRKKVEQRVEKLEKRVKDLSIMVD